MFPNAAVHPKNATLEGTSTLQILFQGNEELVGIDFKLPLFGGDPTYFIHHLVSI
jgi:hypothetical protein